MKKFIAILLVLTITCAAAPAAFAGNSGGDTAYTAIPSTHTIYINWEAMSFDVYNIDGSNYFKLRDLAFVLSETEKQFELKWIAETETIHLIGDSAYTPVGGEMAVKGEGNKSATPTQSDVLFFENSEASKSVSLELSAYNIEGNNYFKLRDIAEQLDFSVFWNSEISAVFVDTGRSYSPPTSTWLNADYATDELIGKYASCKEFIEFDEDGYQKIIFVANTELKDFKFITIGHRSENNSVFFFEESVLYSIDKLTPEEPFVVTWVEWGTMPHRGISFVDENNVTRYFTITSSGLDGSLLITEF